MYDFCLAMMANSFDADTPPMPHQTAALKNAIINVLKKRMSNYDTSIEADERILLTELGVRERMAVEVRLGEKRILKKAFDRVATWVVGTPSKRIKTK